MTDNHPITPPPELLQKWYDGKSDYWTDMICAAQWGADQELGACCAWLGVQETQSPQWFDLRHDACALVSDLRAARRPKPPSLKEQALAILDDAYEKDKIIDDTTYDTICRALEALPND